MTRKEIEINGHKFKTQNEAEEYSRNLLNSLKSKKIVTQQDTEWAFLSDLIKRHSSYDEKLGPGIKEFLVGESKYGHIELNLKHVDDNIMDISWRKCVSGKQTPVISNLKAAMRVAIESQINAFRAANISNTKVCELCSLPIEKEEEVNVDHVVHFEVLFKEFLSDFPDHPEIFDDEIGTNRAKFYQKDLVYETHWVDFHKTEAQLRIVHKRCNLSRTKS